MYSINTYKFYFATKKIQRYWRKYKHRDIASLTVLGDGDIKLKHALLTYYHDNSSKESVDVIEKTYKTLPGIWGNISDAITKTFLLANNGLDFDRCKYEDAVRDSIRFADGGSLPYLVKQIQLVPFYIICHQAARHFYFIDYDAFYNDSDDEEYKNDFYKQQEKRKTYLALCGIPQDIKHDVIENFDITNNQYKYSFSKWGPS